MALFSSIVIGFFRYGEVIYVRLRKKYLKFLPPSPIGRFPIFTKELFRLKTSIIAKNFDPVIRKELQWYNQVHYDIKDSQESIDIANILNLDPSLIKSTTISKLGRQVNTGINKVLDPTKIINTNFVCLSINESLKIK
jgi:hypothetical protein